MDICWSRATPLQKTLSLVPFSFGLLDVPVVFNKINFAFTTHGMVKENFHINVHHKFTSKAEEITIGKVPPHPFSFFFLSLDSSPKQANDENRLIKKLSFAFWFVVFMIFSRKTLNIFVLCVLQENKAFLS